MKSSAGFSLNSISRLTFTPITSTIKAVNQNPLCVRVIHQGRGSWSRSQLQEELRLHPEKLWPNLHESGLWEGNPEETHAETWRAYPIPHRNPQAALKPEASFCTVLTTAPPCCPNTTFPMVHQYNGNFISKYPNLVPHRPVPALASRMWQGGSFAAPPRCLPLFPPE